MFNKGDIFFLNDEGKTLFQYIKGENGIIISDRYILYNYIKNKNEDKLEYFGYDILINELLFKEIPEKFLSRVIKGEENIK